MRRDVIAARPMASLATGLRGRLFAGRDGFIVRVFVEVQPYVGVTGLTDFAADVTIGRLRSWLSMQQQRQEQ